MFPRLPIFVTTNGTEFSTRNVSQPLYLFIPGMSPATFILRYHSNKLASFVFHQFKIKLRIVTFLIFKRKVQKYHTQCRVFEEGGQNFTKYRMDFIGFKVSELVSAVNLKWKLWLLREGRGHENEGDYKCDMNITL